ncbi:hypothetical protein SAMN04489721_3527 [Agromyces flavus]|uniref:Uncharacterized protein n=1 Tax=Agromyces flavus TaxID=589382 RepID=A0A1H2A5Y4_9MICO|nr:hypothetical protein SAMN04489721_3527 [Agromyces flavus]
MTDHPPLQHAAWRLWLGGRRARGESSSRTRRARRRVDAAVRSSGCLALSMSLHPASPCTAECRSRSACCSTGSAPARSSHRHGAHGDRPVHAGVRPRCRMGDRRRMLLGAGDAPCSRACCAWWRSGSPTTGAPAGAVDGLIGQSGQILAVLPLAALLHATSWSVAFGSLAGLGRCSRSSRSRSSGNRPPAEPRTSPSTRRPAPSMPCARRRPAPGVPRVVGPPGHAPRVLVAFHDPVLGTAFVLLWGFPS